MTKRKRRSTHKPVSSYRWLAGGLVIAAIAVILGLKMSEPRVEDLYTVQERMEALPDATPFVAASSSSQVVANPSAEEDPFPKHPAAQIEWAMRNGKPALMFFHSTTCIPCKNMDALIARVRSDYEPAIVFVDVIVTDRANADLIRQARIQAIPTTFFVNNAGQGRGVMGGMDEAKLRAELDRLVNGEG